jgi:hypothetical protein
MGGYAMNKRFLLALALVLGMTGNASAVMFNGHDYILVEDPGVLWEDAQAAAPAGYHLATIASAAENAFIADLVNGSLVDGEEYFLGGSQPAGSANGDDWSWENGEGLFWDGGMAVGAVYENWNPIEPSGDGNHVAMWTDDNRFALAWAGTWNDEGNVGHDWMDGYVLESVFGACCTDGPGTISECIEVTQNRCAQAGPQGGLFLGANTSCADVVDCTPLLVTMDSIHAQAVPGGVMIGWTTATEIDTVGFRVLREMPSTVDNEKKTLSVIAPMIAAAGNQFEGASYQFLDRVLTGLDVEEFLAASIA